jgi:hypothetical protein
MRVDAQTARGLALPPAPHAKQVHLKHVLVIGRTKGCEHDSVSDAMASIYNMGQESGLWDTTMRTETELLTKRDLGRNAKNLNYFDLIVFASTTGELEWMRARSRTCCRSCTMTPRGSWHSRGDGYELQLVGVWRDDRRLVRSASVDDIQCADYQ